MATKNVAEYCNNVASLDQKLAIARRCSHEGVMAGAKAAVVATIATAIPTLATWADLGGGHVCHGPPQIRHWLASARMLPWARANLNPAAQALIISTAAGMAYFIVADKTILATARKNSFSGGDKQH